MTAPAGVRFGPLELDLLGTFARKRFPFPLRVPSFGRIESERRVLLASAGESLAERGLATERGPVGAAAELVTALRRNRGAVDLVVIGGGTVTGVVAMISGARAVVCRQELGDTPSQVTVTPVTAETLTGELVRTIPNVPATSAMPMTVPPGGGGLAELLPTVSGRGQLGVVLRTAGRPFELSWLDSPEGRVRIDRDAQGWVSVNPLRHNELQRLLREAVTLARAEHTR